MFFPRVALCVSVFFHSLVLTLCTTDLTSTSSILEYPPFHEVIHWDGMNRVVLEKPQVLESYILMPVFGLPALDVFKRRLYVRAPLDWLTARWVHITTGIRF